MFKRILVPLDGSRFSSSAMRYAIGIARRFDAQIILIEAVKPVTPSPSSDTSEATMVPMVTEVAVQAALLEEKRHLTRAKQYLQRRVRDVTQRGIKCSYRISMEEPADSILKICRKEGVELIVMSTHGKGGLKRAILGSVADEVARKSRVPVMLIRQAKQRKRKK